MCLSPKSRGGTSVSLPLYFQNADAGFDKAVIDSKVRAYAEKRSKEKKQRRYDALGHNCQDYADEIYDFARGAKLREILIKN